jgi:hypothetical protein
MLEILGCASGELVRYLEVARASVWPYYVTSLQPTGAISLWITGRLSKVFRPRETNVSRFK